MPKGVYVRRQPTEAENEARFWSKVRKTDGCWIWQGATSRHGYGAFGLGRRHIVAAHRFAYELANGPVPSGMNICHHCDNPPCVRADHLFPGTDADNVHDMWAKGRGVSHFKLKSHCVRGHEYTPENSAPHSNGKNRRCRVCRREDCQRRRDRLRLTSTNGRTMKIKRTELPLAGAKEPELVGAT